MEALPRLPMLSFDLKHSPEYIEFGPVLKQYIKDHYGEDPTLYTKACTDLEQLRQAAIQVSRDYMGCTTLKKYYTQLEYLQKRFPMGEGGKAAISFTWEDVQTGRDHVISDIRFEQACVLYNIGSLHSLLGVLDTRHNVEGMRVSCTHFQCAAWVFEYLRDNFSTATMSTDMSYELLSFHIILMLAQAQECILEKSLVDNRKNNITAKVAAQVVEFYKDASRLIDLADQKQQISSRMHKEWGRRLLMKAAFYQSVTYYCLGRRSQELEKPGECLAYYTAARDELARATQLAKNEVPEVLECLQFAKDVVMGKYEAAKKDNDFVYHEKVPAIESLPEVKGASLAKGILVNLTDKEISGPDIFQKLVPMEAHEASSVYSEEKAKLSRAVVGEIEQKNMELEQFMSSLQLDVEQLNPKTDLIPENLMEKCAAMSVRTNAIKELTESMKSVSGLATEVELSLEEIQEMIDDDTLKTDQFEKLYGKKNPSSVLPSLLEDLAGYRKRHEEGNQLNVTLHKAMSTHTNNLKTLVLTTSEIQAMLPPSQPTLSNEDQEVVSEIRRLLQKVSEMKEQRKALLEQFRDKIQKDDITNVLVTQEKTDKESVFADQLKKHDQLVGYIRQNLSSQDNILRHLTDINAKYALIRQAYNEASSRREKVIQELILSYDKHEELLAKSQKGTDYYKMLLQNVIKTFERCRSECKVRQEERDMLTTKLAPKAPPPSRPTAPKPELNSAGTPSSVPDSTAATATLPSEEFASLSMPGQPLPSGHFQSLPPKFEGPKLKDYLPFMKPRSFGPKTAPAGTSQNVPLPSSVPSDVSQLDSGDYNISQRYPGLDPNLVSVLPATIAQYLASVSSAATSMAGGARYSPSQSPSPQHSATPRHSPSPLATPPPSPAVFQGPHPTGTFVSARHSSALPIDTHRSLPTSQALPDMTPQQNIPPAQSGLHAAHFAPGAISGGAGILHQQQPYEQYGSISGFSNSGQYPNVSRHASTSTVSSASRPIISPGQEATNQTPSFQQQHSIMQTGDHQQFPQQIPQWTPYVPPQQQPQHHSLAGQIPLPSGQQYVMAGSASSVQQPYESAQQPSRQSSQTLAQSSLNMWPQNQFSNQIPSGQSSVGQDQTSKSEISTVPSQTYNSSPYGQQPQVGLQQQAPLGPTGGHPSFGGNQQMEGVNLHGGVMYQTGSPHQSPSRNIYSNQAQDEIPVTSVGYNYAKGRHQGPLVSDYAYPSQQLYQNVGTTAYQPNQPYIGGYQHGIDRSYQNAQTFGTFTSKANMYGQSGPAISTQSQSFSTQNTMIHGQGGYLQAQISQQPAQAVQLPQIQGQIQGPQIQGQIQGHQIQSQIQGPQGQIHGSQLQSQIQGPQIQGQLHGHQLQGQFQGPQIQGQVQGPQLQGQILGPQIPQVQGQIPGPQIPGPQLQGPQVQNQIQGPQIQGQIQGHQIQGQIQQPHLQGQIQGPKLYGQIPGPQVQGQNQGPQGQGQNQGPKVHGQNQGPQMQVQVQGQQIQSHFQGQIAGAQGTKGQHPSQSLVSSQQVPGQMPFQHLQQLSNQGQHQQFPYSQQQQPGFHQQPGIVTPPGQQNFQQQHQTMMQQPQQLPQQQLVGPYNPQQQMPIHGASKQASAAHQSALSANIANMKHPLQPTSVSGSVRPAAHGQVISRPSTPSSQISSAVPHTPSSPVGSKKSVSRQSSSLDDILSSSPNGVNDTIITPQVLTDQERQLQKEEALKNQAIVPTSEPYSSQAALHKLLADVEAFGKFVDELSVTILGVSRLDTVWKSLLDSQDVAIKKQPMAIARCYPMKNRDPDIMPYDDTRVILTTTKDDFINASWLNDLAPSCPKFITTQAPMPVTIGEFWAMVYEQGSEVLVQITSEYETGKKYPVYYPVEKDKALEQGAMLLSLQSVKFRQHWVERIIYLKNVQTKQARTLVHLQYKNWPVSGFPDEISSIVHFISEVHTFYMQQRSLTKPIIVHCGFGIGRTGVFTLVYTAMQEILHGNGVVDVPGLARRMLQKRKGILHKKEQLKCCYDAVLCFAEEYLQKRGILVKNPHFSQKHKTSPKHQPQSQAASDDIVLGSVDLQTIRENVGRLRVQTDTERKDDMSGLTDQSLSKKSLESLPSIGNSSLPDVVQQYSDTHIINEFDKLGHGRGSRNGSDPNSLGLHQQTMSVESPNQSGPNDANLGQTILPQDSMSPTDRSIMDAINPGDPSLTVGNVPFSLAQLQDPATFTMGSPDSKKKSKITKANFHQSKGTLSSASDPADPLGSLDPLWTMGKK